MASLPTYDDLTDEQVATILDAFRPYDTASDDEAVTEFLRWLRANILADVQRRLYIKLHSGMGEQEQAIVERAQSAIPDPHAVEEPVVNQFAPVDITEGVEQQ
jgi:hypothetical protein